MRNWEKIKQRWHQLCWAFLAFVCAPLAFTQTIDQNTTSIYVVYQQRVNAHQRIVSTLRQNTPSDRSYEISYIRLGELDSLDEIANNQNDSSVLIVALGTNATERLVARELPYPLLSAAIPRLSFRHLKEEFDLSQNREESSWFSAIYLDQPLSRTLNFIQTLLPDAQRIGVALGNDNTFLEPELREEITNRGLLLSFGQVASEDQLINTLNQVLDQSDVYIGIVDPLVFSRTSAKNVLRTAYRWRVPLIGISPAYVNAGALGAIYSSPEQIGVQLLETIDGLSESGFQQPSTPESASSFTVTINYRVAEALGVQLDSEERLAERVRAMELHDSEEGNND